MPIGRGTLEIVASGAKSGRPSLTDSEAKRVMLVVKSLVKRHGGPTALGRLVNVSQPAVTRWLDGGSKPSERNARTLFEKAGLPPDSWRDGGDYGSQLDAISARVGLTLEEFVSLAAGQSGTAMDDLGEDLRRAALAAVLLFGHPLEAALVAAQRARDGRPRGDSMTPEMWLAQLRGHLPNQPQTGTHIASTVALAKYTK